MKKKRFRTSFKMGVGLLCTSVLLTSVLGTSVFAETSSVRKEKVLGVLVEFTETAQSIASYKDPTIPGSGLYDGAIKDSDTFYNNTLFSPQGNSVRNFYLENSNGSLEFQPAEETCGNVNDGIIRVKLNYARPNQYVEQGNEDAGCMIDSERIKIVEDAMGLADQYIDFSSYDTDSNGKISSKELHVIFMLSSASVGKPKMRECSGASPILGKKVIMDNEELFNDFTGNGRYAFCDSTSTFGTICHEIAHDMYADDLYKDKINITNVGYSSLMCWGSGHIDPFSKIKMGLITPDKVIDYSGTYTINSVDENDLNKYNVLKIPLQKRYSNGNETGTDEYFLLENRQFQGFDSQIMYSYNSGGIGIWHVDTTAGQVPPIYKLDLVDTDDIMDNKNSFFYKGGNSVYGKDKSLLFNGQATGISIAVNSTSLKSMNVTIKLLDEPQNLTAVKTVEGGTKITWNPVDLADEYEVSVDNQNFVSVGANTSYTVAGTNKHIFMVRGKRNINTTWNASDDLFLTGMDSVIETNNGEKTTKHSYANNLPFVFGDVSGDEIFDSADYMLLNGYLTGKTNMFPSPWGKFAADVNDDGVIDSGDYTHMNRDLMDISALPVNKIPKTVNLPIIVSRDGATGDIIVTNTSYGSNTITVETFETGSSNRSIKCTEMNVADSFSFVPDDGATYKITYSDTTGEHYTFVAE
jgi:M6 family metalloprotease-like protein